jgi:hypothetical protein
MRKLEERLAHSFHLIGQQIHYNVQFDRTVMGVVFNALFLKKSISDQRAADMSKLSILLSPTLYVRLRNTTADNIFETKDHLQSLMKKLNELVSKWGVRDKDFWYCPNFYDIWLKQLQLKLDWYELATNTMSLTSYQRLIKLQGLAEQTLEAHYGVFLEQQSFWSSWWLWFNPPPALKILRKRMNLIKNMPLSTQLQPTILLMLHAEIMIQALKFYKESLNDIHHEFLDDLRFAQSALEEIQATLSTTAESINESVYADFRSTVQIRFQHQKDTDWHLLYASLAECAQSAQLQAELCTQQEGSFFTSSKKTQKIAEDPREIAMRPKSLSNPSPRRKSGLSKMFQSLTTSWN